MSEFELPLDELAARLQQQAEAIIASGFGTNRRVIVKLRGNEDTKAFDGVLKGVQRRSFALSARDCLPPKTAASEIDQETPLPESPLRSDASVAAASLASIVNLLASIHRCDGELSVRWCRQNDLLSRQDGL